MVEAFGVFFVVVSSASIVVSPQAGDLQVVDELHFPSATEHLTRIDQLIADSAGGAWAIDARTPGVLRFTDSGEMLTFGAAGSGPGEFERPWRLTLARDTLWVADIGTDRITGLDPEAGELLSSISGFNLWRALPMADGRSLAPIGITESGGVLVAIDEPESGHVVLAELGRDWPVTRHDLVRLERSGNDLHIPAPGGSVIRITNPFSNADLLTLDNRGRYVGRLRQRPSLEARLVGLRNDQGVRRLSWPKNRRQVTEAEREEWLSSSGWPATFTKRGIFSSHGAARKAIEAALTTDLVPFVQRRTRGVFERGTFVDISGGVWFEGWSLSESPRTWHRLDHSGLGSELTLGRDEILLDVVGRFGWKQRFDSLGVPHLTRLTIERSTNR